MNQSYLKILTAVREFVTDFRREGYDIKKSNTLAAFLSEANTLPIGTLFNTFPCHPFEKIAVALGLAVLTDAETAAILRAQFDCPPECVTPQALSAMILGGDTASCVTFFSPDGMLARLFDGTAPTFHAPMRLKPSIFRYLLDSDGEPLVRLAAADGADEYLSGAVDAIAGALSHADGTIPMIVNINGVSGSGRKTALSLAASNCGMAFAAADRSLTTDENSTLLALMDAYPLIFADDKTEPARIAALAEENSVAAVISETPLSSDDFAADLVSIAIPMPSIAEQSGIWLRKSRAYSVAPDVDFREIAMEFNLPPGGIDKAFRYAAMSAQGEMLTAAHIKDGCYRSVGSYMGGRAVQVNCAFSWDDLVLPAYSKKLLRTACDYVRCGCTVYEKWGFGGMLPYGRGASMIFTGPPGTGKTMAAQVVAGELGLALYKVNLASVVSKYIGETEKNLNDIFERARKSRVVLFFDEADVLFGKRTEVKDSNDKYSNMEAAFLLQKIEEYTGVAILATNFVQNFDEAFKRRMKFLVEFPFPGKSQRAEIWRRVFPPEAPVGTLDYDYLVENFELSGSNIKNIAVHSAFLAASAGDDVIGMKHIVAALKNEFSKSGKSFTKAEAGEYCFYLDD